MRFFLFIFSRILKTVRRYNGKHKWLVKSTALKKIVAVYASGDTLLKKLENSHIETRRPKRRRDFNAKVFGYLIRMYRDTESDRIPLTTY